MAQLTAKTETNIESEFVKVLLFVRRDDGSYGGWRTELLIEEITNKIEAKFLLCSYCRGVLRDACLFEKDGKQELACSSCLPKYVVKQIARINAETINEKQVQCPLKTKGCDWTNELSELLHHLKECELFPVVCPLRCRDERGEVSRVERRGVETHRTCCPMRTVKCEYCKINVKACGMNGHLKVCEDFPIPCPNKCSEEFRVKRKDKSIHLSQECPLQETECHYSQYGCEAKVQRRNLEQHEKEDMHKHMKLTISNMQREVMILRRENEILKNADSKFQSLLTEEKDTINTQKLTMGSVQSQIVKLEKENVSFRTKIVNLEKENEIVRKRDLEIQSSLTTICRVVLRGNLNWKVSGVKNKISNKENVCSDTFYVGLYKFQGYIKWNGKEDLINLILFIVKGEWDDALRWPVKYKSSLVLINQLNPRKNFCKEFDITDEKLGEEPKCFEKPKLFENERGYGLLQFISQADILKEKYYCKDDSIELNISVELV